MGKKGKSRRTSNPSAPRIEEARKLYEQALLCESREAWAEAIPLFKRVVQAQPTNAEALLRLGRVEWILERFQDASASLGRSHRLRPDNFESGELFAKIQAVLGKTDEAVETLSSLLMRYPRRYQILQDLVLVLLGADRMQESAHVLQVLKEHTPNHPDVLTWSGNVLTRMHQYKDARTEYEAAVKLEPNNVEALLGLANVSETIELEEEALEAMERVVKLTPENEKNVLFAARLCFALGLLDRGQAFLANTSEKVASSSAGKLLSTRIIPVVYDSVEEILAVREYHRKTMEELRQTGKPIENLEDTANLTTFYYGYHGLSDKPIVDDTVRTLLQLNPELGYVSPNLERKPLSNRRIRVGFLSSNFRKHVVGRTLNGFLKALNRERFEVILLEMPGRFGGGQELGRALADKTVPVRFELEKARTIIEDEQLDIILNPDYILSPIQDYLTYSRLAPVHCTTWGHPGTSGRSSMDYWLTCDSWDPPGNEKFYTENLIRFSKPVMIMLMPDPVKQIASREELGLPEGTLYGCFQSIQKMHPDFDPYLGEILRRDPKGKLICYASLHARWQEKFLRRIRRTIPDVADRVLLLPKFESEEYFSLQHHLAVSLDPLYFGGANTTADALHMGAPVVTLPGEDLRGRQSLSMYELMDYRKLVVESFEQYVDLASAIGLDPAYREEFSREIKERSSAIFDTVDVAREMEAFFEMAAAEAIGG